MHSVKGRLNMLKNTILKLTFVLLLFAPTNKMYAHSIAKDLAIISMDLAFIALYIAGFYNIYKNIKLSKALNEEKKVVKDLQYKICNYFEESDQNIESTKIDDKVETDKNDKIETEETVNE